MAERLIGIVYNEPAPAGHAFSEASLDVLAQVEAIEASLGQLGRSSLRIPFTRDVGRFIRALERDKLQLVFNLCETVEEDPRFAAHPAAMLELLGMPFSGSSSTGIMLSTDKLTAKRLLKASGICTPDFVVYNGGKGFPPGALRYPVIVKPRYEDASIGIDQESIFEDEGGLKRGISGLWERFGSLIVEEYIHGREFNVSLLGYPFAEIMPLAEIDFSALPADFYSIVGYRAKWDRVSFEYRNTPRRFPRDLSSGLKETIQQTATECFRIFMLRDYARVDMRVNGVGEVYVLEINANPCLSPDAGFAASAREAGVTYTDLVAKLLDFVVQRTSENGDQAFHCSG